MKTLHVSVVDKVATYQQRDGYIVCGNTDYEIKFTFDSEWDEFSEKIARFIWNGKATEVKIENGVCPVPKLRNTEKVTVGVRAGDLHTTTPAEIGCKLSILCGDVELTEQDQHYTSVAEEASLAAEASAEEAKVSETNAATSAEAAKDYMETAQRVATSSENLQAQIDRNSKRITNIEQGLVPDPFETDDSVAYMKGVPANALPYAEIQKVGGMTVKDETTGTLKSAPVTEVVSVGANLFDQDTFLVQYGAIPQSDGSYKCNGINRKCFVNEQRIRGSVFVSVDYKTDATNNPFLFKVVYTDGSDKWLGGTTQTTSFKKMSFASDPNRTVDYIVWTFANINDYYAKNAMISFVDMDYTPYKKPNTIHIPEAAVQALDGYGDGVNESLYNYIDWEKKQFVKQVGKVDLGTIVWYWGSNTSCNAGYANRFKPNAKIICVVPSPFGRAYIDAEGVLVVTYTADSFATAAEVKAALSGVMLYYELATPEITDISDLITADNFIAVEPYGTLTFENEHQYDVPSTVVYQLKGVSE